MKKDGTVYNCVISDMPTDKLHELVPGSGNRSICIDYNIQVPLIPALHMTAHGRGNKSDGTYSAQSYSQKQMFEKLCEIMDIDPIKTWRGVKEISQRGYLEEIKEHCREKLRGWER